jgi:hypothetical protein
MKIAHRQGFYHWRECLAQALTFKKDVETLQTVEKLRDFVPMYERSMDMWHGMALEAYAKQEQVRMLEGAPYCYDALHYEEV